MLDESTTFDVDIIELERKIKTARDFALELSEKYKDTEDPLERFRLYYILDNLRITMDSIDRHLSRNG